MVSNVEGVAKSIHNRLHREQLDSEDPRERYHEEEINPLFRAVMTGCKETLKRQKMVSCPNDTAPSEYRAQKYLATKGWNLGEAAAEALSKWVEREQEADILMLRWEASLT